MSLSLSRIFRATTLACTLCLFAIPALASQVLEPVEEGAYTIAVLPDTQWYALSPDTILEDDWKADSLWGHLEHFDDPWQASGIFRDIGEWIVDNRDEQNIVFVSHVGDIVEWGRDETARKRWEFAREVMDILHGEIPYAIAPGNHDLNPRTAETFMFEEFFGAERYAGMDWYGGSYRNNTNSYQKVEANGEELLFIHLVCNPKDDALEWADAVLSRYSERIAIVTTHLMLAPVEGNRRGGMGIAEWKKVHRGMGGNTPRQMWDKLLARHANVRLVLCGDQGRYQAWHMTETGEHGNAVHLLLSDYKQSSKEGYIRLLRISPEAGTLEVITYSPTEDRLCDGTDIVPERAFHQFTLDWRGIAP